MTDEIAEVAVVGGGVAGSAAALRAAQYGMRITWVRGSRESARRSRGHYVQNVDNMIAVHPEIVLSKVRALLGEEQHAAARTLLEATHLHIGTRDITENALERVRAEAGARVEILDEEVLAAGREQRVFVLTLASGELRRAHSVVLATGVMDRQPRIKRELRSGKVVDDVRWIFPYANYERLLYCIRCEGHLTKDTPTVVIGAGETAAQIALMLHERYGTSVTMLANGERAQIQAATRRLMEIYGIELNSQRITDLFDRPPGAESAPKAKKGSELHGFVLEDGQRVPARFAMVALGLHRVYNDLARQLGAELESGDAPDEIRHVSIADATAETSVEQLFAIGDMAWRHDGGPMMKQVYTAQEYAVRAIDTIDRRRRKLQRAALLDD